MGLSISPVHGALIAGGATALAVGIGETRLLDSIARKHPTGSDADTPGGLIPLASALTGFGLVAGGMIVTRNGNGLGALMIGAGIGAIAGSFGAGIAFTARHGVGVDTEVNSTFSVYNRDWDDTLELNPSWFRTPEYVRRVDREWEDSDGDTHHDTDYYTISRLAFASDVNHDGLVTRPEMRAVVNRFDRDGDGRLKGNEFGDYNRMYGEESWWGNWNY